MPLIHIDADFKLLIKELRRIAVALETHLLVVHKYRIPPPDAADTRGKVSRADVTYADNESTMKHDIDSALGRIPAEPDEADEDEDENVFL